MNDAIITLQELIEYQREDIAKLSEELYAQQREVTQLKLLVLKLNDKIQALESSRAAGDVGDEPPPPHY